MDATIKADNRVEQAMALFCRALEEVKRLERRPVLSAIEYVMRQQEPGFEMPGPKCADIETLAAQAERCGLVRMTTVGRDVLVQHTVSPLKRDTPSVPYEVLTYRKLIEEKMKCPLPPASVRQVVFNETAAILARRGTNTGTISLRDLSYSAQARTGQLLDQKGVFKLLFALVLGKAFVIERNPRLHQIGILSPSIPVEGWDDIFVRACVNALRCAQPGITMPIEFLSQVLDKPVQQLQLLLSARRNWPGSGSNTQPTAPVEASGITMQVRCAMLLIMTPLLVTATVPAGAWHPTPLARYDAIVKRMPFGQPPRKLPPPLPATPSPAAPPAFATKLTLSAINRTQAGPVAVGFVDNSQTPPRCYVMNQNESRDGFTVLHADFEGENAIIEKDGTAVTLWIHATERRVITDIAAATQTANASGQDHKPAAQQLAMMPPPRAMFSTATEQLMSMIASAEPGTAPPPLPISDDDDDAEEIAKTLKTAIVIHEDDDEQTVKHKENVAWIKDDMRKSLESNNETGTSYIKRLYERQKAIEQARAEEAAKMRKLADLISKERIMTELESVNKRLQEQGIPALGQVDVGIETEAAP